MRKKGVDKGSVHGLRGILKRMPGTCHEKCSFVKGIHRSWKLRLAQFRPVVEWRKQRAKSKRIINWDIAVMSICWGIWRERNRLFSILKERLLKTLT